ncbi:phage tail protein [Aureimonas leprariae]|uniref:phage tail protein n=1 Tax=Plantimonas leprariae TaxID=2615207 RepID=UPI0013872381|nr:phage tail protein [Aureimonas leprariae]
MELRAIARLLPEAVQAGITPGSVLETILAVIQSHLRPAEAVIADLDRWFDPRRAPEPFVRMLAGWLGLDPILAGDEEAGSTRAATIDTGALRELVAAAAGFARARGTVETMIGLLETATATRGFRIVENPPDAAGRARPFHIRIEVPKAADRHRALVERIVSVAKPAFVTAEIGPAP